MISFNTTTKMTDRSVVATCSLGGSLLGTGLSGSGLLAAAEAARPASLAILPIRERSERPTQAPAVVAKAAQAYAHAFASINGAGSVEQHNQRNMWAFRGLEPWRDPA